MSQQFPLQTMNQRNDLNSRPRFSGPPAWTGSLPNYNFVNPSVQRKCSFPPHLPIQQGSFQSNQFSYFTPFVFPQTTFNPNLTTGIRLNNDWQIKRPSTISPEQYNAGNTIISNHGWSNERALSSNHFHALPNIGTQVENGKYYLKRSRQIHKSLSHNW